MRFLAVALIVTSVMMSPTGSKSQPSPFDAEQRRAIEGIIKQYLLTHPEIIQEAIGELEQRQQHQQETARKTVLRNEKEKLSHSPRDYVIGNPSGDVTLVEFFDYNCSYCRKAKGDIDILIKGDPNLRVVLKDFPVLGPDSIEASRVAVAAKGQLPPEKLRGFHDKLMETRGRTNRERALAVAREFGLDVGRLERDMQSESVAAVIRDNAAIAERLGIAGTPAFILNEDIISGAVGVEPLRQAIASARKCGKAKC